MNNLNQHLTLAALDGFKKADKLDGGRCQACQEQIIKLALEINDWKSATTAAEETIAEAQEAKNLALAHCTLGVIYTDEGLVRHKQDCFEQAHEELTKALAAAPNFPQAIYEDGFALAHLNQDAAARVQFETFIRLARS